MSQTEKTSYSIDELSQETGLETRVIRSFIEQGLLRGPSTLGRYARYSRQHLDRLRAIKVLKDKQGLRLSEVRQQLLVMSDAEIAALAETGTDPASSRKPADSALEYILSQSQQFLASDVDPIPPTISTYNDNRNQDQFEAQSQTLGPRSLAQSIRAKLGFKDAEVKDDTGPATADGDEPGDYPCDFDDEEPAGHNRLATPIDRLAETLKQKTSGVTVRRQAKREVWYRIQVTPDIELSVRGINDEQLSRLERVADYLRELLTGGIHGA